MVQFRILSGKNTGQSKSVRNFPSVIGRSKSANLRVEERGVWDRHIELMVNPSAAFSIRAFPEATVYVNGDEVSQADLKLGDLVEIGSCKMEFFLEQPRSKSLNVREALTWALLGTLFVLQAGLIYWLLN